MLFVKTRLFGILICGALSLSAAVDNAQAASFSSATIPDTAVVIGQAGYHGYPCEGSYGIDACISQAQPTVMALQASLKVDHQCSAVYRQWVFNKSGGYIYYSVNLFCAPRALQQQQILSLYKACETSPQKECFEPKYLDYLNSVQLTRYIDVKGN